jgi:hypothetical protein
MTIISLVTNPVVIIGSILYGLRKPIAARVNKALGRPPKLEPGEQLVTLDWGLPEDLKARTLQDLCYCRDVAQLDANGAQLRALGYPLSARELQTKASRLRAALPPGPSPCAELDPTLTGPACTAVLSALQHGRDAAQLKAFAASLRSAHPRAAQALDQRAAALAPPAAAAPAAASPDAPAAAPPTPGAVAEALAGPAVDTAEQLLEDAAAVAGEQPAPPAPPTRPRGKYVTIRSTDRVRSEKLSQIGSGNGKNAHLMLLASNPHLVTATGALPEFLAAGSEVSVPDIWAGRLSERGFDVRADPAEEHPVVEITP